MVARTPGNTRDDAAIWAGRCAGLGIGLVAVLGAVMLGWIAWPALIGGMLGGGVLLAYLTLNRQATGVQHGVAQPVRRGIRPLVPENADQSEARIAA